MLFSHFSAVLSLSLHFALALLPGRTAKMQEDSFCNLFVLPKDYDDDEGDSHHHERRRVRMMNMGELVER